MATTVNGLQIKISIIGTVAGADGARVQIDEKITYNFSDGTAANQVGYVFQDLTRPLNATTEDLNLDALKDFGGDTITANNVKLMYFRNLDLDTGDSFKLGGAPSNAFINWVDNANDKVIVGPGGLFLLISPTDGYGITASTGDLLRVEAVDNSTYRLMLAGDDA